MNILFAYNLTNADNEFVKIHISILQDLGCDVSASLSEFWRPTKSYDILIINWPDYFFGWRVNISDMEVEKLNSTLVHWQRLNTQIFTFFHDEYSHFGRGANLNLLFELCYAKSDVLIHLGEYSKNKYSNIYEKAIHAVIHHPVYKEFKTDGDAKKNRNELGIKKNELFVLVPGAIRKREEINYALNIFRSLKTSDKRMLFMRTSYLKKPTNIRSINDFKSAVYWLIFKNKYSFLDKIYFNDGFMDSNNFSHLMAAANLVIIPRTDILNSGNIILAAQFGKSIIGTGTGNTSELLNFLKQTVLSSDAVDTHTISLQSANLVDESLQHKVELYSGHAVVKNQWKKIL